MHVSQSFSGLFFMENGDDFLEIEGDAGSFAFCTFTDARLELLGVRDLGVTDFGDSSVLITPSFIPLFSLLVNSPIFTFPTTLEAVENPEGLSLGEFETDSVSFVSAIVSVVGAMEEL